MKNKIIKSDLINSFKNWVFHNEIKSYEGFLTTFDSYLSTIFYYSHKYDDMRSVILEYAEHYFLEGTHTIGNEGENSVGDLSNVKLKSENFQHFLDYIHTPKSQKGLGYSSLSRNRIESSVCEITRYLGKPYTENHFKIKGLVFGQVQAGKTSHMVSLAQMAIDLGYKMIIVLTSSNEKLRNQTQTRIYESLVGTTESGGVISKKVGFYSWAEENKVDIIRPISVTTSKSDKVSRFTGGDENNVFVAVLKKNSATLKEWLKMQASSEQLPTILFDDEADWGSINTLDDDKNVEKRSMINGQVREIIAATERITYVAYTATPFANLLAKSGDKENNDNDVYPDDFISYILPGEKYKGFEHYFLDDNQLNIYLEGYYEYEDKLDWFQNSNEFDDYLSNALLIFTTQIFAGFLKSDGSHLNNHFIINVSRLKTCHSLIRHQVQEWLRQLKKINREIIIEKYKELFKNNILNDSILRTKYDEFIIQLSDSEGQMSFDTIVMNSANINNLEDLDSIKKNLIIIGGDILSRGLTFEKLQGVWFLRNVNSSDTFLQMARWFGYHNKSDSNPIILNTSEMIYDDYCELSQVLIDLQENISGFAETEKSYDEFVARILANNNMQITARNKSKNAIKMPIVNNYSSKPIGEREFIEENFDERKLLIEEMLDSNDFVKFINGSNIVLKNVSKFWVGKLIGETSFLDKKGIKEVLLDDAMNVNVVIMSRVTKPVGYESVSIGEYTINPSVPKNYKNHKLKSLHTSSDSYSDLDIKIKPTDGFVRKFEYGSVINIHTFYAGGKLFIGYTIKFCEYISSDDLEINLFNKERYLKQNK